MTTKVQIGTVIHGTLRTEDLLEAFADELERLDTGYYTDYIKEARRLIELPEREFTGTQAELDAVELVHDFQTYLNDFAPPHTYFGSIEGDGSDFGFWPTGEPFELCETVVTHSPSYLDQNTEWVDKDCNVIVQINDHGNVTVMTMNREELWSAV